MTESKNERKVVIAGGSGFLGISLARHLLNAGFECVLISRNAPKAKGTWRHVFWNGCDVGDWQTELDNAVAMVNLAGRTVDCIKTPDHQDEILRSRVEATLALGLAVRNVRNPPPVWLQMSTAHIYGDPPEAICTEESAFGYGLAPFVARAWEEAFRESVLPTQRGVVLRTSFEQYSREQAVKRKEQQQQFTGTLDAIGADFPRFPAYLKRRKKDIERVDAGLSPNELRDWETAKLVELPAAYRQFLRLCKTLVIGDELKIGLDYTFVSKGTEIIPKDSICFGDWFLECDGDQLYFCLSDQGHAVYYYASGLPEFRKVADSFLELAETFPRRGKSK